MKGRGEVCTEARRIFGIEIGMDGATHSNYERRFISGIEFVHFFFIYFPFYDIHIRDRFFFLYIILHFFDVKLPALGNSVQKR